MKRAVLLIVAVFLSVAILVLITQRQSLPVLSVCDIVRNPEKWEGKIVAVKGALRLDYYPEPAMDRVPITPVPPETCSYPTSKYVSSDEPPEIELWFPDGHFLAATPDGYSIRESTLGRAQEELETLKKRKTPVPYAKLTVEGFISLRKYNLREIQKNQRQPHHTVVPVILTLQSALKVEAP